MFKKILNNKNSIIFTWSLSLAAIVLIPIMINSVVYINAEKTVRDEISRSNAYVLEQLKSNMDSVFNDIDRLSTDITFNDRIRNFMVLQKRLEDVHRYDANRIINDLKGYALSYKTIDYFYLYFPNSDIILTPDFMTDSKTFYNNFYPNEQMDYNEWKNAVFKNSPYGDVSLYRKNDMGEDIKTIAFTSSLPINNAKKDAILVIMVDEASLQEQIKNAEIINDNWIFIINRESQTLLSNTSVSLPLGYEELYNEKGDIHNYYIEGQKAIVSYITSQGKKFKYALITPSHVFWENLHYMRVLMIFNIVICMLLGVVLIYLFVKRNYNPINKIVRALKTQTGNEIFDKNEYGFIEKAIEVTFSEKQKLMGQIRQQNPLIVDSILARLLKGRLAGKISIEDSLASFDIEFVFAYFSVVVFKVEDFNVLFAEETDLDFNKRMDLTKLIMTNIIEELMRQRFQAFMTEIDGMMVCLINYNLKNQKQELLKVIKESRSLIKQHFNIEFTAAVSSECGSYEEISQIFQEALYAMEYKVVIGIEETVFYEDIQDANNTFYYYPFDAEQKLINLIKAADFEKAKLLVEQILKRNLDKKDISSKVAKHLMFSLINTAIRATNELRNNNERYIDELDQLLDLSNINEMYSELINIIKTICNDIKEDKENRSRDIIKEITDFIGNNYHNNNLSITLMGEHLNLTPYYVSRLFKEETGEGLQDYINKYRIEKAKEILCGEDMTIEMVSQKVGYSNIRTFIRVFKKHEGIPPGKYKKI